MLLNKKTAIVYGASGAVGAAVARAFAREGARVVLAARRKGELETVAADIHARGGTADVTLVDATDKQAVEAHLAQVAEKAGPVKVMFNAIDWGDTQGEPLGTMSFDKVLRPVQTGLTTWFYTGTAVAEHMARNGGGSIVGISANAGRQAFPNVGGFGIACAAVEQFLRQLAVENGPFGVRVNWVRSPGSPDSPGVHEVWSMAARDRGTTFDEIHQEFAKDTPLRRITPLAQIADAAVLLASDLAAAMTATVANATGGAQID